MVTLLVTTGAESSGKTTLAAALASALEAPLVQEQSRIWLTEKLKANPGYHYKQDDLLAIARLQYDAEQQTIAQADQWVVCDTDLLVIMIWSQVKYGNCSPELDSLYQQSLQLPRRYLLCSPDMPWQADPLRENPHDRHTLHQRYHARLQQSGLPFLALEGTAESRLAKVLEML